MMITYNGKIVKYGSKWVNNGSPVPETAVIGGKTYPVVEMPDGKKWLAVNLDFVWDGLIIDTSATLSGDPHAVYDNYDEATYGWNGYRCGLLYNGAAVTYMEQNKSTLFPGWHVATSTDWTGLLESVGGVATVLKAVDGASWPTGWNGTDDYGFGVLPAGYYNSTFQALGTQARFYPKELYYIRSFTSGPTSTVISGSTAYYCYSVRLVQDSGSDTAV